MIVGPEYCQLLARYARWMNERMYAALRALPDAVRKEHRGAYFGSIHRTLNHLLWADRTWLGRITGTPFAEPAYGADRYDDFDELARERDRTDTAILDWAGQLTPAWLAGEIEYRSASDGRVRRLPNAIVAMHLFQHGVHHRGQVTTLMSQAGIDPGVTDLPWLPGIARTTD